METKRKTKHRLLNCLFVGFLLLLHIACSDTHEVSNAEVIFDLKSIVGEGEGIHGGKIKKLSPHAVMVTIKNSSNTVVSDRRILDLHSFGSTYLSVPLTLSAIGDGMYKLSEFFVIDENGDIIYATPIEGSQYAHLVDDPLDIEFSVSKNKITTVTPEVLEVTEEDSSEAFGYGQFGFKVVKKIKIIASSFIKGSTNFELTESKLSIVGISDTTSSAKVLWKYDANLSAAANIIYIKESPYYRLTATKLGYKDWKRNQTLSQNEAIEIIFDELELPLLNGYKSRRVFYYQGNPSPQYDLHKTVTFDYTSTGKLSESKTSWNGGSLSDKYYYTADGNDLIHGILHSYFFKATTFMRDNSQAVTSMQYVSTMYSRQYKIVLAYENQLITAAKVTSTDISLPTQYYSYSYDANGRINDFSAKLESGQILFEGKFTYTDQESWIPAEYFDNWFNTTRTHYSHFNNYEMFIPGFTINGVTHNLKSYEIKLYAPLNPSIISYDYVNFNYSLDGGKPSKISVYRTNYPEQNPFLLALEYYDLKVN